MRAHPQKAQIESYLEKGMYQRILVALGEDDTAMNAEVLSEAVAIARASKGVLNLLHVLFPPGSGFPNPMYLTADGMHSTVTNDAFQIYLEEWHSWQTSNQKLLDEQANTLAAQGVMAEWTQAIGDPGSQICQVAQGWNADLIVMGRHHRSGMAELLVGSVSNYVMHHASCSVIAVQSTADQAALMA